jgi:hypothetical protein
MENSESVAPNPLHFRFFMIRFDPATKKSRDLGNRADDRIGEEVIV